jgi:hypothetical protein
MDSIFDLKSLKFFFLSVFFQVLDVKNLGSDSESDVPD